MSRRPSRRSVLRAGLAVPLLAACTAEPAGPAPPPDPDVALRERAVVRERALLTAYDAAMVAAPTLTARLTPLRAEHAQHLAALEGVPPPLPAQPDGTDPAPGPAGAVADPAADPVAVLAGLVTAERQAAGEHAADALAGSRQLATLLATLAASEATHPVALA